MERLFKCYQLLDQPKGNHICLLIILEINLSYVHLHVQIQMIEETTLGRKQFITTSKTI